MCRVVRTRVLARKKIERGLVFRSKHICGFSVHIIDIPQKGGWGGGGSSPSFPLWLDPAY